MPARSVDVAERLELLEHRLVDLDLGLRQIGPARRAAAELVEPRRELAGDLGPGRGQVDCLQRIGRQVEEPDLLGSLDLVPVAVDQAPDLPAAVLVAPLAMENERRVVKGGAGRLTPRDTRV